MLIAIVITSVGFGLSVSIGAGFIVFGGMLIFLAPLVFGVFGDDIYK